MFPLANTSVLQKFVISTRALVLLGTFSSAKALLNTSRREANDCDAK
jgi:hypothetical protein